MVGPSREKKVRNIKGTWTGPDQSRRPTSASGPPQNRLKRQFYRLLSMEAAAAHLMSSGTEVADGASKRKHLVVLKGQQEMKAIDFVLLG